MATYQVIYFPEYGMKTADYGRGFAYKEKLTETINQWAERGWKLHSMVAGTGAQAHGGLYITFISE